MPRDLGSVFTLDHRDVVLALQIKPELCELPKITAKPHRCICGNGAPIYNVSYTARPSPRLSAS